MNIYYPNQRSSYAPGRAQTSCLYEQHLNIQERLLTFVRSPSLRPKVLVLYEICTPHVGNDQ